MRDVLEQSPLRTFILLFSFLLLLSSGQELLAQDNWRISNEYSITFEGKGVEGSFDGLQGDIFFSPEALKESSMNITLNAASIDTGNKSKDKHARGKNWFDVEAFPQVGFVSESFKMTSEGYAVAGLMTIHGYSMNMVIDFTFDENGDYGRFNGTCTIDRNEFGIEGPFMAFMVGDDFKVYIDVKVER